ncbi:MAG: hypothetical protein KGL02_13340 [Acidobacteriota bacterium]|nr:hypothetical protein [Acidobacteriota bacterium]MDE3170124.1 hypothetical protein [Acidobacteriota bacterium]
MGLFDNVAEGEAEPAITAGEEAGSVSMAVDGAALDFIVRGDRLDAAPVKEFVVNGFALGMTADGAAAGVVGEKRGASAAGLFEWCIG